MMRGGEREEVSFPCTLAGTLTSFWYVVRGGIVLLGLLVIPFRASLRNGT